MYIITLVRECPLGSGKCTKRCVAIGPPKKARQIMSTSETDLHKVASMQEAKLAIPYSDTFAIPMCSNKWSQTTDSPPHFLLSLFLPSSFPLPFLFSSSSFPFPLVFLSSSFPFSFPYTDLLLNHPQEYKTMVTTSNKPPPSPANSDTFGFEQGKHIYIYYIWLWRWLIRRFR